MQTIKIVTEKETYRVITDGRGRYAVIEARAGHVYSLDPRHSVHAEDTPEGMAQVVGFELDICLPAQGGVRCANQIKTASS